MENWLIDEICSSFLQTPTEENINKYIGLFERIPSLFANSSESLIVKMNYLNANNMFNSMNLLFGLKIQPIYHLKIIKFWDFLLSTCGDQDELFFLFSSQTANLFIKFPFSFADLDVLRTYFTVLKSISSKCSFIEPKFLFTIDKAKFPLYENSIMYISHPDSIVVSSARLVVLNLCNSKIPIIITFINSNTPHIEIQKLMNNLDSDSFAFLVDFISVAPHSLARTIKNMISDLLEEFDLKTLCRSSLFLVDTCAKSIVLKAINHHIIKLDLEIPLSLGLLLHCIEKKLLYIDTAITIGLVPPQVYNVLPRFSNLNQDLIMVNFGKILSRYSYSPKYSITLILILRIWEKCFTSPPEVLIELNNFLIDTLLLKADEKLVTLFIKKTQPRPRYDLDFLVNNPNFPENTTDITNIFLMFFDVRASISRWRKEQFVWFNFNSESERESFDRFNTTNYNEVDIYKTRIRFGEETIFLNKIEISHTDGDHSVCILIHQDMHSLRSIQRAHTKNFEFLSPNQGELFKKNIQEKQKLMIQNLLKSLYIK